ncbi:MAG TPA: helix-turn-helix transcriptional regulator [Nevskiaceae bacterium]
MLLAMLEWLVGDDGGLLPGRAETAAGDVHHAHLHSILRYIDARVGHGGVTVDDVAQHFHVSRRYAYKLFAMDGLRPARYIADLTLQRCREALGDPDCQDRIEQIACRFGFHDASSFSHAFSRCFGMAPRAYRAHAGETTQMEPRRAVPSRES